MTDLADELTDEELDGLDRFLLDRIDEDAVTEGKDEGVLGVSELDGFLTAIVSGPVTLVPSRWLPAIWGDFEPLWQTPEQFDAFVSLVVRHMNGIVYLLMEHSDEFEPMYLERATESGPVIVVDEWCDGYLRGVALSGDEWSSAPPEIVDLLTPIRAFTEDTDWLAHEMDEGTEVEKLRSAIAPNVRAIHTHWLRLRMTASRSGTTLRRGAPRRGRNDPHPSGSAKKRRK